MYLVSLRGLATEVKQADKLPVEANFRANQEKMVWSVRGGARGRAGSITAKNIRRASRRKQKNHEVNYGPVKIPADRSVTS